MSYGEPDQHEFAPGQCALCGKWKSNPVHDVAPARPIDAPVNPVGGGHPETAQRFGRRIAPRLGSLKRRAYDYIDSQGDNGATAREVGVGLGIGHLHQSYSPAVTHLKQDGWIKVKVDDQGRHVERDGGEVMVIAHRVGSRS